MRACVCGNACVRECRYGRVRGFDPKKTRGVGQGEKGRTRPNYGRRQHCYLKETRTSSRPLVLRMVSHRWWHKKKAAGSNLPPPLHRHFASAFCVAYFSRLLSSFYMLLLLSFFSLFKKALCLIYSNSRVWSARIWIIIPWPSVPLSTRNGTILPCHISGPISIYVGGPKSISSHCAQRLHPGT